MKKVVLIVLFACLPGFGFAQKYLLVEGPEQSVAGMGHEVNIPLTVSVKGSQSITVAMEVVRAEGMEADQVYFTLDDQGSSLEIPPISLFSVDAQQKLPIMMHLESGLVPQEQVVEVRFYDFNNPQITLATYTYTLEVEERDSRDMLYLQSDLQVTNMYPNPVQEKGFLEYRVDDTESELKVVVRSLLGQVVGEYELDVFENRVTIDMAEYEEGVYFYSLVLDDQTVATKKFLKRE